MVLAITEQNEPEVRAKGKRLKRGQGGTTGSKRLTKVGTTDFTTVENAIQQEKNFNKEIFAPSKEELKQGEKAILKEVNIVAKKALK